MIYKLTNSNAVIRQSDGAYIPFAEGNSDYAKYLAWIAEGNLPDTADEQLSEAIRAQRVPLLQAADAAINTAEDNGADASALRKYRQALRDVTGQKGFPGKVTWPKVPT